jgi:hypothetical protein
MAPKPLPPVEPKEKQPELPPETTPDKTTPLAKILDQTKPAKSNPADQAFLKRVNAYRKLAGLRPLTIDPELSEGCVAHAKYLILHDGEPSTAGLGAHDEKPESDGFTEKGRTAGRASVIAGSRGGPFPGGAVTAVDGWMASFFHRIPFLNPDLKRIGIGYATNTTGNVWFVVLNAKSGVEPDFKVKPERTDSVIYPSDKQKEIPRVFNLGGDEIPNPLPRGATPLQSGYPITATFPDGVRVEEATATLEWLPERKLPDFVVTSVPVWLSTPEKPANTFDHQQNTVCLIPKAPLQPLTTYRVKVRAKVNGDWKEKTWNFSTGVL